MKYLLIILAIIGGAYWYVHSRAPLVYPEKPMLPVAALAGSAFANLEPPEQDYYIKIFYYTLDTVNPKGSYNWESYTGKGSIAVSESFISKSNYTCRNFHEDYVINAKGGQADGVACKRVGSDGWCRLKKDNALTCAMENPPLLEINIPNAPNMPDAPKGGIGGQGNTHTTGPGAPNMPQGVNAPDQKTAGTSYADTVTGTAGKAAGPATGGAIQWFNDTFR